MALSQQFADNVSYLDALNSQNASPSYDLPASTQFALANSVQPPDQLQYGATVLANFQAQQQQQAQAASEPIAPADPGPTGDAPTNPAAKSHGLLQKFLDVVNVLGAPKRLTDHLVRLGAAAGVPAWEQAIPTGIGAALGGLLGGPEGAGGGSLVGESLAGLATAIVHGPKGDLGDLWRQTKTGQTMGQMVTSELGIPKAYSSYKITSGTVDAALAIADDPTSYLGSVFKGFKGAKALSDAANVDKLAETPGFQRWAQWAAKVDSPERISRVAAATGAPLPARVAVAMADAKSAEEVTQVFKDAASLTLPNQEFAMKAMPQFYKSDIFRAIQRYNAWDGPSWMPHPFQALPRQVLDSQDADFIAQGRKYFQLLAPKDQVDGMMNDFLRADDVGRVGIVRGAAINRLKEGGLTDEAIQRLAQAGKWTGLLGPTPEAIQSTMPGFEDLADQALSPTRVSLPGYRELRVLDSVQKLGVVAKTASLDAKLAGLTGNLKALWIMRPAFALRVAMDEGLASMAMYGTHPIKTLDAVSNSWIRYLTEESPHGLSNALGEQLGNFKQFIEGLPGYSGIPVEDAKATPKAPDLITGQFEEMPQERVPANVRKAVTGPEKAVLTSMDIRRAPSEMKDQLQIINAADPAHTRAWLQKLNYDIRTDPLGYKLLENWQNPNEALEVAHAWAQSDEGAAAAKNLMAGTTSPLKGTGAVTPHDIANQRLAEIFGDREKDIPPLVPEQLRNELYQRNLSLRDLRNIPIEDRPPVLGYKYTDTEAKGPWQKLNEGFHHATSVWLNNMVRDPQWTMRYNQEYDRILNIATKSGALGNEVAPEQLAHMAANSATTDMLKVIHNPLERTKFDVMTRSIIPFNFAYVQFFKRWGRAFEENPAFAHRLSMLAGVGQHEGFFSQDDKGNTLWHLPIGNEFFQHTLGLGLQRQEDLPFLSGPIQAFSKAAIPPLLPFSSHVMPGFSPIVTVPASVIAMMKPDTQKVLTQVLGPSFGALNKPGMGFADRILSQVAPSWTQRLSEAALGDQGDNNFATTMINAMQYYGSKGAMDAPPRNPKESDQDYARRVRDFYNRKSGQIRNTARLLHLGKMVESLFAPYSPLPDVASMKLPSELRQLRAQKGYEAGTQAFLDKYGDKAEYYLQSMTQAQTRDASPSSEYQKWADSNQGFLKDYPNVGGMLAPRGAFNQYAYQQQLSTGERKKLSPNEWLLQVAIKRGDDEFYNTIKPRYEALVKAGLPSQVLSPLYNQWKQELDAKYPGWLTWRNSASVREGARQAAILELQDALADPRVPQQGMKPLREFMQSYGMMKGVLQAYGLQNFSSSIGQKLAPVLVAKYHQLSDPNNPGPLDEVYKLLLRYELQDFGNKL